MNEFGCCSNDVGFGTKEISDQKGGRHMVCRNLLITTAGRLLCGHYTERPDVCRDFDCHTKPSKFSKGTNCSDLPEFYSNQDLRILYAKYGMTQDLEDNYGEELFGIDLDSIE